MEIKVLTKADISACAEIILQTQAGSDTKEVKQVLELSLQPGIETLNPEYYVLWLDDNIVGISGLYYDYEDPTDILWMDYFAISPNFQRQGHGTKMLENLENICRNKKVRMLCVFTDNDKALNFYNKNGFQVCGKIENYYPENKSRIWLYKNIV